MLFAIPYLRHRTEKCVVSPWPPIPFVVATLLLLAASPALAQKAPDGFKVELLYRVPEIEHPSCVTCDDQGNLFVGEDPMDMRGPTTKEFDRIQYIRWDKDGKPTKTVFAENLSAVFGVMWLDGWLYVLHAPHYSRFRDNDGDGKADVREELADGFGPPAGVYGFNDHIVTGIQRGLDGYVYVSVGDKGIPKATGKDGSTITLEGGGVVRMRPDGTRLEIFTSGTRNHLDVPMDHLGNIFTYDNTDDGLGWWTRFTHHIPTGYYGYPYDYLPHPERHLPRVSEHGGGSPVGAESYRGALWPEKYRNTPFFCEWGKGKVQCFHLKKAGASFTSEIEDFLVREGTEEFRPLDLCFSPDGKAMYLADWNFGGWVKNQEAGRLFRVTYVGTDVAAEPPRATDADPIERQLTSLSHPAYHERDRAQRRLAREGAAAVAPLTAYLAGDHPSLGKIHAIWALNDLAEKDAAFDPTTPWVERLKDADADVRAQAARALGTRRLKGGLTPLISALKDADPSVRLHAAVALGRLRETSAMRPLAEALGESDVYARFAMIQAMRTIGDWKSLMDATMFTPASRTGVILAATAQFDRGAVELLDRWAKEGATNAERVAALAALATVHRKADPYVSGWWGTQPARNKYARPPKNEWEGTPVVLAALLRASDDPDAVVRLAAVKALATVPAPEALHHLEITFAKDPDEQVRRAALATFVATGRKSAVPAIVQLIRDPNQPAGVREDAVRAVAAIDPSQAVMPLISLTKDASSPSGVVIHAMKGLAAARRGDAVPAVTDRLNDPRAEVRTAAVNALAAIEGKGATAKLVAALKDADTAVRQAACEALGQIGANQAVPNLIAAARDPAISYEATLALTQLVDRRALPVYLDGLVHQNQAVRDASREALTRIRGDIGDDIVHLHERNELTPGVRSALQSVFTTPSPIVSWHLVGVWPKESRPEFDFSKAPDFKPVVMGDKKRIWKKVTARATDGAVEPAKHFRNRDHVWAVGYTTVDGGMTGGRRQLTVGSDDQLYLFLNGKQVYAFERNRGWSPAQDRLSIELAPGPNHLWAISGNDSGPWDFSVSMSQEAGRFAFLFKDVPAKLDPAAYVAFARKNKGDADRGARLFADVKGVGCIKCHSVGGQGAKVGPDMIGIGTKYPREELIRSVLEPSSRVLDGFAVTVVATVNGEVIQGIVKKEGADGIELINADGKERMIPTADIEEKTKSNVSLMPNGLKDGMTLQDFTDIIAYLESLKNGPVEASK